MDVEDCTYLRLTGGIILLRVWNTDITALKGRGERKAKDRRCEVL